MSMQPQTSAAQARANRANAQHSTGPRTAAGNSTKHGLTSRSTERFAPKDQEEYNQFRANLENELQPIGLEEKAQFERHAFCLFMIERAQAFEAISQEHWMQKPSCPTLTRNLVTIQRYRRNYERDADRAFKNLADLQAQRILRAETNSTLQSELNTTLSLPPAADLKQLLSTKNRQSGPTALAARVLIEDHLRQNASLVPSDPPVYCEL
jgi:hypothetical protein